MVTFEIEASCDEVLARLFETDNSSHLSFGWTGHSTSTAQIKDLIAGPVRFRDYIMEGFLTYSVQLIDASLCCTMQIIGEGSNRDWSIRPQVRHYIKAAGLEIRSENVAEQSHALEPAAGPDSNGESSPPAQ
jgi:hypothetical protein